MLNKDFTIFVIGGNKIYNMLIPYCKTIWLTRIKNDFNCDLIFDCNVSLFSNTMSVYDDDDISILKMMR